MADIMICVRALIWTWRRPLLALWGLAVVSVVVGSVLPSLAPPDIYDLDKLIHCGAYALLAGLPMATLANRRLGWVLAITMACLGAGVEVVQAVAVEGREGSVLDALANVAGVTLGGLVGAWLRPR